MLMAVIGISQLCEAGWWTGSSDGRPGYCTRAQEGSTRSLSISKHYILLDQLSTMRITGMPSTLNLQPKKEL